MRPPAREAAAQVKVSSPLIRASFDSNESDPIDIAQHGGLGGGGASSAAGSSGSVSPRGTSASSGYARARADSMSSSVASGRRGSYAGFSLPSPQLGPAPPRNGYQGHSYGHSGLGGLGLGPGHAPGHSYTHGRRTSLSRSVGSFVGSYEESLLTGRLSQTPSRPVDFTASIGVLGSGKCKPSLRCPPHLVVDFPAYFYSDISPYVGQIDLEQSTRRGYRIPAQGQLQIVIKNPNKTAVKFFLVPYDVSAMPVLHKTFFRQKHYEGEKLRYAIHVQICRTQEGKYYIYRTQRVVFASRAPDGRESLKVVTQHPEPQRYTPWVPEKKVADVDRAHPHTRPDAKEPRFIGGSLLDAEIPEEEGVELSTAPAGGGAGARVHGATLGFSPIGRRSSATGVGVGVGSRLSQESDATYSSQGMATVANNAGSSGLTAALAAKRSPVLPLRHRPIDGVPTPPPALSVLPGSAVSPGSEELPDLGSRLRLTPSGSSGDVKDGATTHVSRENRDSAPKKKVVTQPHRQSATRARYATQLADTTLSAATTTRK